MNGISREEDNVMSEADDDESLTYDADFSVNELSRMFRQPNINNNHDDRIRQSRLMLISRMKIFRQCVIFSFAFSIGETMLVTSISFASIFFHTTGAWVVAMLYWGFAIGTLFASLVLENLFKKSLRPIFVISQMLLVLFHIACVMHASVAFRSNFSSGLLIVTAFCAGSSLGIVWPAEGAFITNASLALSCRNNNASFLKQSSQCQEKSPLSRNDYIFEHARDDKFPICQLLTPKWLFTESNFGSLSGHLNGLFASVLILCIILGHTFSALIVGDQYILKIYIILLLGGIFSSVLMYCFVEEANISESMAIENDVTFPSRTQSIWRILTYPLTLTYNHSELFLLSGVHISSGFRAGLILSFVGNKIIHNPKKIGILLAAKMIVSLISTSLFTKMGNSPRFGRIFVIKVGVFSDLLAAILALVSFLSGASTSFMNWAIYLFAGVGFSAWQGTASGALLSEASTYLSSNIIELDQNLVTCSAFSGCKAISGFSSTFAFILFGNERAQPFVVFGTYFIALLTAIAQLSIGEKRQVWRFTPPTNTQPFSRSTKDTSIL